MTRRLLHVGLILVVFASVSVAQDRQTPLPNLLKALEDTPGFESTSEPTLYDTGTFENLDRDLASKLKLYGSKGAAVQSGRIAGSPAKITVLQMLDAPAAYGVYTLQRTRSAGQPTAVVIGAASFQRENELYFWQSNYAVKIEGSADAREQLAISLSRSILGRSQKPPVSAYLPSENLVEGTERYLLSSETIERAVGLNDENLGFDSSAEAATGTYRVDGKAAQLLLVLYPTQHIARKYADEISTNKPSTFQKRAGPLVAIVYGSTNKTLATSILEGVKHEFKVTWDEPMPGLGVSTMLVTIFTFIAVALAFTTIAGVSFGGLRVFVKSRYPNRVFDRPEAMEVIQLKLIQGLTDRQLRDKNPTQSS